MLLVVELLIELIGSARQCPPHPSHGPVDVDGEGVSDAPIEELGERVLEHR